MTAASVVRSIDVDVDPQMAFEVFTSEIHLWYQPGPHSWKHPDRAVGTRLEPGVGGRWLEVWDAETGEGFEFGRITVWEPGERLVLDFFLHDGGHVTEVEVSFAPVDSGTRVTLEHRGWDRLPPDVVAQGMSNVAIGWPVLLGWYADHVAGRSARSTTREHR
jgi:uncharacterized protein YndB with AHSA1/START domain